MVAEGLTKSFGPVRANKNVSLQIRIGEVLGLVGENGAGKSTLLSMLSGTLAPDTGTIQLHGERIHLDSYHEATLKGIFRVYQHQALIPNLTVAENIYLSQEREFQRLGLLSHSSMVQSTQEIFDELGVDLSPSKPLSRLSFAERQVVEIVRCLAQARLLGIDHPVILLDEPTSALTREQIDFFFSFVNKIKSRAAQVFISHRLDEIVELCDRLVVLKDGEKVAENDNPRDLDESEIHSLMVGRSIEMFMRDRVGEDSIDRSVTPALELENFTSESFRGVNLTVYPGEVVGIAGVVGSGKSHLGRAVYELGRGCQGHLRIRGETPRKQGPRAGIRHSVGYVPTERHKEGLVLGMSVAQNHSLPYVGAALSKSPVIDARAELGQAREAIDQLKIRTPSPNVQIRNLSGGNQQKVIIARWLTLESQVLVLDNPTNGVDVGAKAEIYKILEEITSQGVAVLLISDDLPELITMSDRILVMKDGQIRAEHSVASEAPPAEVDLVAEMV